MAALMPSAGAILFIFKFYHVIDRCCRDLFVEGDIEL